MSTNLPEERLAFSVIELSRALGVSHPTVYKAINAGHLTTFRLGSRRLVSRDAALAFIAKCERVNSTSAA